MNTPTEIARQHVAREKGQQVATAKREAWAALQQHTPEFVPDVRRIAERFGISGVRVEAEGETVQWGDV